MNKPIHQQLGTLIQALQSATMRNDLACLELIQKDAVRIISEVKALEEKDKPATTP